MSFDEIRIKKQEMYGKVLDTIERKAVEGDRFFVELFLSHIMQMPVSVDRVPPAVHVADGWSFVYGQGEAVDLITGGRAV